MSDTTDQPVEAWHWPDTTVTCSVCGKDNPLHEQDPAYLATLAPPDGVVWECNFCHARNVIAGTGEPVARASDQTGLLECQACHATFAVPGEVTPDTDGSWTCPVDGVINRTVGVAETATSQEATA